MQSLFARILDNALILAALLFAVGAGLASLRLGDPAVIAFLACGMLLMLKSGMAPAAEPASAPGALPTAGHA
ncbi:hypothetical protein [Paracraurococcus ruber]|uniref:Uncharacterized protein n=1 Tax=Paracraurococcus ruber TaxID=77675 RepID=A0ABS1D782_9PROT|nr:hypothetical protein [Paracraurococcus ruber]MBK1662331.1 hypothetical protein [Paracraurococcus ruber]TDG08386.1 hypothetical protein E2C05_31355 [Paracraurococcus ruber]